MTASITRRPAGRLKIVVISALFLAAMIFGVTTLWSQRADALSLPAAPTVVAAATDACNRGGFLGLKPWYNYMPDSEIGIPKRGNAPSDKCGIKCFNLFVQSQPNDCGETNSDIPGIILAIIDDLLRIAGLVAVAFIIIGSFEYVGSRGNAEKTASAQSTIIAALTGLAVALVAVGLVAFIGNRLT